MRDAVLSGIVSEGLSEVAFEETPEWSVGVSYVGSWTIAFHQRDSRKISLEVKKFLKCLRSRKKAM